MIFFFYLDSNIVQIPLCTSCKDSSTLQLVMIRFALTGRKFQYRILESDIFHCSFYLAKKSKIVCRIYLQCICTVVFYNRVLSQRQITDFCIFPFSCQCIFSVQFRYGGKICGFVFFISIPDQSPDSLSISFFLKSKGIEPGSYCGPVHIAIRQCNLFFRIFLFITDVGQMPKIHYFDFILCRIISVQCIGTIGSYFFTGTILICGLTSPLIIGDCLDACIDGLLFFQTFCYFCQTQNTCTCCCIQFSVFIL